MSLDNPKGIESSVSKNTKQRRTFLKRATAGAALVSIPGRSAWATVNGSVVASGNGSNTTVGACIQLLSHGKWKTHLNEWGVVPTNETFSNAFGGLAFIKLTGKPDPTASITYTDPTISLQQAMSNTHPGPGNVNVQMAAMYITAANHGRQIGSEVIYYPVLQELYGAGATAQSKADALAAYGRFLYTQAISNPGELGKTLGELIDENHAPSNGSINTNC
jgi:hypothetical protein